MTSLDPLIILFIGIIMVVGGIIGLKLHPFLALLLGAFSVAILTSPEAIQQFAIDKGLSPAAALSLAKKSIGERIATEFGNTCAKIGILIAMAAIIGKCMLESGAAERIIRSILKFKGIDQAPIGSSVVLIYATDGYGDFPMTKPSYPVLWLATKRAIRADQFPFGVVVRMKGG